MISNVIKGTMLFFFSSIEFCNQVISKALKLLFSFHHFHRDLNTSFLFVILNTKKI